MEKKTLSTLKRGASEELNKFFAKPTEVFKALREIAKDKETNLYGILHELEIKPSKIGFNSFGRFCVSFGGNAEIVCESIKRINGITYKSYTICDRQPREYIELLVQLLKEKRQRDANATRWQKHFEARTAKEDKAKEKREKTLAKMVAELVKCGLPAEIARANAETLLKIA
ncbi:MAG: hypothetical protein EGQ88_01170 [Prevotellamassilia timonensis]|nr:hypothetical protein [Prevotellamassilia timonensis]